MKLNKIERRVKCDVGGCKNLATYEVVHPHSSGRNRLYMCRECMLEMYKLFGSEIIPESPKTVFSGSKKRVRGEKVEQTIL